jgi:tRNA pseudouridine38-40 synthase
LSWHVYKRDLNESAMNAAVQILLEPNGPSNLSAFRKARSAASHTNISVLNAFVERKRANIVELEVTADWFVYGMMRLLTTALVNVGTGLWSEADFRRIVERGERSAILHAAPAAGLCLLEVGYKPEKHPFQGQSALNLNETHLGLSDLELEKY